MVKLRLVLCAAVGAAVITSLISTFVLLPVLAPTGLLNSGIDEYDVIAANLLSGHGYKLMPDGEPTMIRMPLYIFFLRAIFSVFGMELWPAQVIQCFVFGVNCLLVYLIAAQLFGRRYLAAIPMVLYALYPGAHVACWRIATETFFTLCLLLAIYFLLRARMSRRSAHFALAGLCLGLGIYLRPTLYLFPPFLFGSLLLLTWRYENRRALLKGFVVTAAMSYALLAPWVIRNYLLIGHIFPGDSNGMIAAYDGYYIMRHRHTGKELLQLMDESWREQERIAAEHGIRYGPKIHYIYGAKNEYRLNTILRQKILVYLRENPLAWLGERIENIPRFWYAGRTARSSLIAACLQLPYVVLAVVGAAILIRRSQIGKALPLVLLIVYFNLVHAAVFCQVRYSMPLMAFMVILGAVPLAMAWERLWYYNKKTETQEA